MPTENETIESLTAKVAHLPNGEAHLKAILETERRRADDEIIRAQARRQQLEDAELAREAKLRAEEARAEKERERVARQERADEKARLMAKAAHHAVELVAALVALGDDAQALGGFVDAETGGLLARFGGGWPAARFLMWALTPNVGAPSKAVRDAIAYVAELDAKKTEGAK